MDALPSTGMTMGVLGSKGVTGNICQIKPQVHSYHPAVS